MRRDPGGRLACRFRSGARAAARAMAGGALAGGLLALSVGEVTAQQWKEFRSARQAADLESLEVEVVYGAGRLAIGPAEHDYLYDARIQYDADRFLPVRAWSVEDGHGRLRVSVSARDEEENRASVRLEARDLNRAGLRRIGDTSGRLDLGLSRSVPTRLHISVGAAESQLRLGGLPLRRLVLDTGASETRLGFGEVNPVRMDELELRAGAASFRAEGLGNANFERFRFRGGVGDVTLDFGGRWSESARASISMGVGSLRLRVPQELAVRIRKSSVLTAFDAPGFVQIDNGWQTENWTSADTRLEVDLDAAFGSITVERSR